MRKFLYMFGTFMILYTGLWAAKLFLVIDSRTSIGDEFGLSWLGASFVHECIMKDDDYGYPDRSEKRKFCGCLGQDMARNLSKDDLEVATFVLEQNRKKGIAIPRSATARTDIATRFATALEDGMAACRYNFG